MYAILRDGALSEVLEGLPIHRIISIMGHHNVSLLEYNQFIYGDVNSVKSADGVIEIARVNKKWLEAAIKNDIKKTKTTLRWLESLQEEYGTN